MPQALILRAEREGDEELPAYSFSMLTAINTCPMWGHVSYGLRKTLSDGVGRAMPLETGALLHEVFAAIRIFQLLKQGLTDHAIHTSIRLFGTHRHNEIWSDFVAGDSDYEVAKRVAYRTLHTSGWEDDPNDRRRTLAEIELSAIAYIQQYNFDNQVWVKDKLDPSAPIGIEWPFSFVLVDGGTGRSICRIIGTIDGISYSTRAKRTTVDENKSSSRLGDAWEYGHTMSHQMTMYKVAASILVGEEIEYCNLYGLAIPQPKRSDVNGFMLVPIHRRPDHVRGFAAWVYHSVQAYEHNAQLDIGEVVQYTHSCNRYFRPCSLIPFCYSDIEDRKEMLATMNTLELTPTEQALMGDG